MANIRSAKKRARQSEVRRIQNASRKSAIKTSIQKLMGLIQADSSSDEVQSVFRQTEAKIARAKNKGVLHVNTAIRTIGRLARRLNIFLKNKSKAVN